MGCLGVHFALTEREAAHLRSLPDDQSRLDHLQEVIEETYFGEHPDLKAECDKSWDAMHRALADGQLTWDGGEYPLSHVVLAGTTLQRERLHHQPQDTTPGSRHCDSIARRHRGRVSAALLRH